MKRTAIIVVIVACLALAGCTDDNSSSTGAADSKTSTAATPTPTPSPTPDCVTHWDDRYCGQEANPPKLPETKQGTAFHYTSMYMGDDGELKEQTVWTVTLTKADCGLASLPEAADNPKWDGGDSIPQYTTAKPGSGNQFCLLQWDWTNAGKHPGTTDLAGSLYAGDQYDQVEFAKSDKDQQYSQNYMASHYGYSQDDLHSVNPGGKAKTADVYTLPTGAVAVAVDFPEASMVTDTIVKVNLAQG